MLPSRPGKDSQKGRDICRHRPPDTIPGQVPASPLHRRRNATPSMTELKSYDLPELEALAEQIKAEIAKREQEEQERARQAAEAEAEAARQAAKAEAEAARQAQAAAEAAAQAAAEKAAESARRTAEKKEAAKKAAAKKVAEKKAAEEADQAAKAAAVAATAPPAAQPETAPIRYMHPSNRALTWSGQGPIPDWINAWLVTGGTLYALEIAAEKLAPKPIPESFKLR